MAFSVAARFCLSSLEMHLTEPPITHKADRSQRRTEQIVNLDAMQSIYIWRFIVLLISFDIWAVLWYQYPGLWENSGWPHCQRLPKSNNNILSKYRNPIQQNTTKSSLFRNVKIRETYGIASQTTILNGERIQLGQTLPEFLEHLAGNGHQLIRTDDSRISSS